MAFLMTAPGCCCGSEQGPCEFCSGELPDSLSIDVSGLGEDDDCCENINKTWILSSDPDGDFVQLFTPNGCTYRHGTNLVPVCFFFGFPLANIDFEAQFQSVDVDTMKLVVKIKVYLASPPFTTWLTAEFEKEFEMPIDCCDISGESLDLIDFTNSVDMNCSEGSLAATATAACGVVSMAASTTSFTTTAVNQTNPFFVQYTSSTTNFTTTAVNQTNPFALSTPTTTASFTTTAVNQTNPFVVSQSTSSTTFTTTAVNQPNPFALSTPIAQATFTTTAVNQPSPFRITLPVSTATFTTTAFDADLTTDADCITTNCCDRPLPGEGGNELPTNFSSEVVSSTCECLENTADSGPDNGQVCLSGIDGKPFVFEGGAIGEWRMVGDVSCLIGGFEACELSRATFMLRCGGAADADGCTDFILELTNEETGCVQAFAGPEEGWSCDPFDMTFVLEVDGCNCSPPGIPGSEEGGVCDCQITIRIFE